MPKIASVLTDTTIASAKAKDKIYYLGDGQVSGLSLAIKPCGSKLWRLNYTSPTTNKRKTISVNPNNSDHPILTLKDARTQANALLTLIANGIDPSEQRTAEKAAKIEAEAIKQKQSRSLFKNVAYEWLERHKSEICETHYKKTLSYLEKRILPIIGNRHIDEVEKENILQIICKLDNEGSSVAARKCLTILRMIYKHALTFSLAKHNVVGDIDTGTALRKRVAENFRFIQNPKDVGALLRAIDSYNGDYSTKMALKFLPLVFTRPHNVRFMEWIEIDFDNAVWSIPGSKMKMRNAHIVPLSRQAIEILKEIQRYTGSKKYVFASSISGRQLSENTLNVALKRIGFGDSMVSHGFRHLASTLLNSNKKLIGIDSDAIERQLAHKEKNAIKSVYDKSQYLDERTHMMQWWASFLDELKKN